MQQNWPGVGSAVLGDDGLFAGLEVEGGEGSRVTVTAVEEVKDIPGPVKAGGAGAQRVIHGHLEELRPSTLAIGLQKQRAAIGCEFRGEAHLVVIVDDKAKELG